MFIFSQGGFQCLQPLLTLTLTSPPPCPQWIIVVCWYSHQQTGADGCLWVGVTLCGMFVRGWVWAFPLEFWIAAHGLKCVFSDLWKAFSRCGHEWIQLWCSCGPYCMQTHTHTEKQLLEHLAVKPYLQKSQWQVILTLNVKVNFTRRCAACYVAQTNIWPGLWPSTGKEIILCFLNTLFGQVKTSFILLCNLGSFKPLQSL